MWYTGLGSEIYIQNCQRLSVDAEKMSVKR